MNYGDEGGWVLLRELSPTMYRYKAAAGEEDREQWLFIARPVNKGFIPPSVSGFRHSRRVDAVQCVIQIRSNIICVE